MVRLSYDKVCRGPKLLAELLAAVPALGPVDGPLGPVAVVTVETTDAATVVTVPDTVDRSVIDAVVAAHDVTTLSPSEQQLTDDVTSVSDLAAQAATLLAGLATIRTHMATIQAGSANPTAVQTGTALKTIAGDVDSLAVACTRLLKVLSIMVRRAGV